MADLFARYTPVFGLFNGVLKTKLLFAPPRACFCFVAFWTRLRRCLGFYECRCCADKHDVRPGVGVEVPFGDAWVRSLEETRA